MSGTAVLRIGLGSVFLLLALLQGFDPQTPVLSLPLLGMGSQAPYLIAAISAAIGLCILLGILGRIAPVVGGALLVLSALAEGWGATAVRDAGLAFACFALATIHEEHIPVMARRVLGRMFGRR